jgi:hypothetical protein
MTDWDDIDDHGQPQLLEEWRAVQEHPPLEHIEVHIPRELLWLGRSPPQ